MVSLPNVLEQALGAIGREAADWYRFVSREQDARGAFISTYADPVVLRGSWQPVDVHTLREMGYDSTVRHCWFYASAPMAPAERLKNADVLGWNGRKWEVRTVGDWFGQNGWVRAMCVDIGDKNLKLEGDGE